MSFSSKTMSSDANFFANLNWDGEPNDPQVLKFEKLLEKGQDLEYSEQIGWHPLAFQAKVNDADSPTLREVLNMPLEERKLWWKAMYDELDQLLDKGTYEIVDRSEAIEKNKQVVGSTWVFKRKRLPDGTIQKLKARFCVRGDLQKSDITKDDVYAPVIDWATVRLLFTVSVACNLETAQIDFRNAFVQSDLPEPIYL